MTAAAASADESLLARVLGSLFWRVFALNALLATFAAVVIAASPFTVSFPATGRQVILLAIGLVVMLAANAVLLRVSLRPLRELTGAMRQLDVLRPGAKLQPAGATELAEVTAAFNTMLARLESERRTSTSRALGGHEEERRRLAGELHDEVGQSLTALLLTMQPLIEDAPAELASHLQLVRQSIRDTLDEVRRIARRLRPTVLDDLGLPAALAMLCARFDETTDARVVHQIEPELPALEKDVELSLYRIAQEALTNVTRHANAGLALLELFVEQGLLVLRVTDDGRGMLYAADVEGGGMRGIRERALAAGASITIRSRPGGGTVVTTELPLSA